MRKDPHNPDLWQLTPHEQLASGECEFVHDDDEGFPQRLALRRDGLVEASAESGDFLGGRAMGRFLHNQASAAIIDSMLSTLSEDSSVQAEAEQGVSDLEAFLADQAGGQLGS